jgi:hypothetical protein
VPALAPVYLSSLTWPHNRTTVQDVLAVICKVLPQLPQQYGWSIGSATPLTATPATAGATTSVSTEGVLAASGQAHFFSFAAEAGPATITLAVTPPFGQGSYIRADLKAAAAVYDEGGVLLQPIQPAASAMAPPTAVVQLPSRGMYYLSIAGVGEGSPKAGGYRSYGSLGWYSLTVAFQAAAVDCVGSWGDWGLCTANCTQTAEYNVTRPAANGGAACLLADGTLRMQPCSGGSCRPTPQSCVGAWGSWSSCSSSCTQTATYSVTRPAANGGAACPVADGAVQTQPCTGGSCTSQDCIGAWAEWSSCSSACT